MQALDDHLSKAKESKDRLVHSALVVRDRALTKVGMGPEDLARVYTAPAVVSVVGFVNLLALLATMANNAWLSGTALHKGQPFLAHLSLTTAQFGPNAEPERDNAAFCAHGGSSCSLIELCAAESDASAFADGAPKNTGSALWCAAADAGSGTLTLLWLGFLIGFAASTFTFLYATKEVGIFRGIMAKVEAAGVTLRLQKMLLVGLWALLWLLLFVGMASYAGGVPDTLGWGEVELAASFGVLRFSFVLTSICALTLASSLFVLWNADNLVEAWMEFSDAPLLSAKKALYLELMLQLILYFFLLVERVDWSALLIVLAAFYLDAKNRNFMLMYLVLVAISVPFDIVHACSLPSFDSMSPGESFGETLWVCIFLLKLLIVGTIYAYEKYEKDAEGASWSRFDVEGGAARDDEIAE